MIVDIQIACDIVFCGFHKNFQNNFTSASLLKAHLYKWHPPKVQKNSISAQAIFRENTVYQISDNISEQSDSAMRKILLFNDNKLDFETNNFAQRFICPLIQ